MPTLAAGIMRRGLLFPRRNKRPYARTATIKSACVPAHHNIGRIADRRQLFVNSFLGNSGFRLSVHGVLVCHRDAASLMDARSVLRCCLIGALTLLSVGSGVLPRAAHAQSRAPSPPATQSADSVRASAKARALLVRGLTRAYVDDYEAAIEHYQQALEHAANAPAILSALADAHAAQEDRTSALYYARQAVRHGSAPPYAMQLARLQRQFGAPEAAVSTYTDLLDRRPDHRTALRALAETQQALQQPTEALRTYEHLADLEAPPSPTLRTTMLKLYRQVGDSSGVETTLRALVREAPQAAQYRLQLGRFYAQNEETNRAMDTYERLLQTPNVRAAASTELAALYRESGQTRRADSLLQSRARTASRSPEALVERAQSLAQTSVFDRARPDSAAAQQAVRLLQRALDAAPRNAEALALLGRVQVQTRHYAAAGSTLTRALDLNPRAPSMWAQAATAFLEARDAEAARTVAEEGLLLFPGQIPLLRASARALAQQDRFERALDRLQEALSLLDADAARAPIQAAIGSIHRQRGNDDAADAAFANALAAAPDDPVVARHVAYDLATRNVDLNRALTLAQRAVSADSSSRALHALGWVHLRRGSPEAAASALRRAAADGVPSASLLEHLGDAYHALGDTSRARAAWQRALDRDPDRAAVREKLAGPK